jgi:hypothetical protein
MSFIGYYLFSRVDRLGIIRVGEITWAGEYVFKGTSSATGNGVWLHALEPAALASPIAASPMAMARALSGIRRYVLME